MTGFTKSHEVAFLIAATLGERKDVMYFLGRSQLALFPALLAERMRLDVTVTDSFPGSAVSFVRSRVALILVVTLVHDLLMLGTVLLTHGEPTAARIGTGTFWFVWHGFTLYNENMGFITRSFQ